MDKCPNCGHIFTMPKEKNKEIYDSFLQEWNQQGMIKHKKITTARKKAIDKAIKNADYTLIEIFKAFENYAKIIQSPDYFWNYKWTMEDFLNRGLNRFVDEAEPFSNIQKKTLVKNNPYENFCCGGD